MIFSAIFQPTTLFSLKESSSTNKGAKSLLLPSPYAIKMAILNQAITVGNELSKLKEKNSEEFKFIRDTKISYYLPQNLSLCVNNSFVKILEQKEDKRTIKAKEEGQTFIPGLKPTISFREYVFISEKIEIIFEVENEHAKEFLMKYIYRINYFGKRGCFFQFTNFSESPNKANVSTFNAKLNKGGILQSFDDFGENIEFANVDNFSNVSTKRKKQILFLPLKIVNTSKSFTSYTVLP